MTTSFVGATSVNAGWGTVHPINWRAKYGGMDASIISQMKALEDRSRESN
jgi:hypothetical protein